MLPSLVHDIFTGILPPFQRVPSFMFNTFKHVLNIFNDFFIVHFSSQFLHFLTFSHLNYVRNHLLATHLANLGRGFVWVYAVRKCASRISRKFRKKANTRQKKKEKAALEENEQTNQPQALVKSYSWLLGVRQSGLTVFTFMLG